MNPRKPTFNVTAKGLTLDNDHLSELAWPFFAVYLALLTGTLVAAFRYVAEPGVSNLMFIVGLWNTFNLIMAGAALGGVAERKQPDRHPRLIIDRKGVLDVNGRRARVVIENVSAGGCALRPSDDTPAPLLLAIGAKARLTIEPIGDRVGDNSLPIVFKRAPADDSGLIGCEFETLQPEEYFILADLMYGDSDALPRFLESRRKHKDIFSGSAQFMWWGATEPFRAFAYLLKGKPAEEAVAAVAPAPDAGIVWLHRFVAKARKQTSATSHDNQDPPTSVKSA
jgi:cellulose synthase (UDP-forming)